MAEKNVSVENHKWTPKRLLPVFITNAVTIIGFVVVYGIINPNASATEKINKHETRISVNETNISTTIKGLSSLNDKVERILDILLKWRDRL
jgi:hypothetical protein